MENTRAKLISIAAATALLAGCGGGGGGGSTSLPSTPSGTSGSVPSAVKTGYAIKVDVGAIKGSSKASSSKKRPNEITTDVTQLAINLDGTTTTYTLGGTTCPATPDGTYTCTFAAAAGSHTVDISTEAGSTAVGYSLEQTASVTFGSLTSLTFTITPVANSFSGTWSSSAFSSATSLPEDQNSDSYPVAVTANIDAPNGNHIDVPIDTVNFFGSVTVTTSPSYTVTPPNQVSGHYSAAGYSFVYDGAQISGDQLAVDEAYTKNTSNSTSAAVAAYNAAVPSGILSPTESFSIPLTRLELPNQPIPSGATFDGGTFDSTGSYFYYPPNSGAPNYTPDAPEPNNDATSQVVFNYAGSTNADFTLNVRATNDTSQAVVTGGSTCSSSYYSVGSATTGMQGSTPIEITPITIYNPSGSHNTGQTSPCYIVIDNGTFSTLTQTVYIYPNPGGYSSVVQVRHRH